MLSARRRIEIGRWTVAIVACSLVMLLAADRAAAAEPQTWGPVTALPSGSAPASDLLASSPAGGLLRFSLQSGVASVAAFESSVLGPESALPEAGSESYLGSVRFAPNGTAVIAYSPHNEPYAALVVRLPDGQFGKVYEPEGSPDSPIVGYAVNDEEVLVARIQKYGMSFLPDIEMTSLSIGGEGQLTAKGPSTAIYYAAEPSPNYGVDIQDTAVALSADGQADVVAIVEPQEHPNEVVDIERDAEGGWGSARSLSAGLPGAASSVNLQMAVTPGGRALLDFQTASGTTVWDSLREPNSTFPAPTEVVSLPDMIDAKEMVAAGGDGTLALAVNTYSCASNSPTEVRKIAVDLDLAPPGQPLASSAVTVLDSGANESALESLGAGHGQALVGLLDTETIAGPETNYCGETSPSESPTRAAHVRAVVIGPQGKTEHSFGSLTFHEVPISVAVDAAGIDPAGDAALTGSLNSADGAEFSYYSGAATAPSELTGEESTNKESGPSQTTTAGTIATTTPGGSSTVSAGHGVGSSPVPVAGKTLAVSPSGHATFTLLAPKLATGSVLQEEILIEVFSGVGHKRHLLGTIRTTIGLKSDQRKVVELEIPHKLLAYLSSHPRAQAQLKITSHQTGETSTVKTSSLAIKLAHKR